MEINTKLPRRENLELLPKITLKLKVHRHWFMVKDFKKITYAADFQSSFLYFCRINQNPNHYSQHPEKKGDDQNEELA